MGREKPFIGIEKSHYANINIINIIFINININIYKYKYYANINKQNKGL